MQKPTLKKAASIASIVIFILLILIVAWFIGRPMVKFVSEPQKFRDWVDSHGIWGMLAFLGMQVLQIIVAIIPGEPLEIGAGYAFGIVEGTLLCMLGILIGSTLIFLFTRKFGMIVLDTLFGKEKIDSIRFLKDSKRLTFIAFILFFIPGTPKDILTYFGGVTKIKLSTWMIISTVARFPSVISSIVGGNALGEKNYTFAIIVFAVTGVVSIIGLIFYNLWTKKHKAKENTDFEE